MPLACHLPWLDHSNYTWRRAEVTKLLVMQFSQFIPLQSKYSPQHPVLEHLSLCSSLNVREVHDNINLDVVYFLKSL
jgi:hypothetical protein